MKTNTWLTLSAIAIGTVFASSAHAGWAVGVTIGGPVYAPAPVIIAPPPCPPPVVCYPPRPVCPPPVVCYPPRPVCPPPVVYVPAGHAWGYYHRDWDDRGRNHGRGGWGRYDGDRRGHGDRDDHRR